MQKAMMVAAMIGVMSGTAAEAQDVFQWTAPAPAGAQSGEARFFEMGTPLMLRTRTEVSTKTSKPGDRLYLEVAESLSFDGQVVVPIGAPAVAEVIRSERNGHFGKKGKIDIRLLYVQTPSGPVRLTGQAADQGVSGTAASVATILFVSPLGFLIHGTSGTIPFGTAVQAHLAVPLCFVSQRSFAAAPGFSETSASRR